MAIGVVIIAGRAEGGGRDDGPTAQTGILLEIRDAQGNALVPSRCELLLARRGLRLYRGPLECLGAHGCFLLVEVAGH